MGSDMDPEWKMLMTDRVRKMLPAVRLVIINGFGVRGEGGDGGQAQCEDQ